jgi:hypothetical protein
MLKTGLTEQFCQVFVDLRRTNSFRFLLKFRLFIKFLLLLYLAVVEKGRLSAGGAIRCSHVYGAVPTEIYY